MNDHNIISMRIRLTKDVECRDVGSTTLAVFSGANNRSVKKNGEWGNEGSFFNCQAWGKTGEMIASNFSKGDSFIITGSIFQEHWTDNQGNKKSGYKIDVRSWSYDGSYKKKDGVSQSDPKSSQDDFSSPHFSDDDIPF